MAIIFLEGVKEQALDATTRAKQLQDLQIAGQVILREEKITGLTRDIFDNLFYLPATTPGYIIAKFGVSHQAASKSIKRLEQLGILQEITNKKRDRFYISAKIWEITK